MNVFHALKTGWSAYFEDLLNPFPTGSREALAFNHGYLLTENEEQGQSEKDEESV